MAAELRRLGSNIEKASKKNYTQVEDFASAINLSVKDVHRLFEGRLILSSSQLKVISEKVNTPMKKLLDISSKYTFVECVGSFKDVQNEDKILDLIDSYIDLSEAVSCF